jgi:putative hemolysin
MLGAMILQVLLIILNATFASAEIAVISMNETKLKRLTSQGDPRAVKLSSLTEQPARFLATIQVAITLASLLGSAFAADNFAGPLVEILINAGVPIPKNILNSLAVFLITLILSYFSLVFGELVPKRIAMKQADSLSLKMSHLLYAVSKVFAPLVALLTASTNVMLRVLGIDPNENNEKMSEEEIRMLLMEGSEDGTIDAHENEIIQNVFEFDDISVEQICTHRIDVIALYITDDIEKWEDTIYSSSHTYYPVCGENSDDIIGILNTKEYFRIKNRTREHVLDTALDKPYFVPESMKANVLFQNMKNSRIYFAVVLDEYGGLSGIITVHDLIEEIVGNLYETEEPADIEQLGEDTWCIQGCAPLDDVADCLGIKLPLDDYDTYGGYLCSVIGRVPNDGESFECETSDLHIQVHSVFNHRILSTTVRKLNNKY